MAKQRRPGLGILEGPVNLPASMTDDEEVEFWETHELSASFLRNGTPAPEELLPPVRPRSAYECVIDHAQR